MKRYSWVNLTLFSVELGSHTCILCHCRSYRSSNRYRRWTLYLENIRKKSHIASTFDGIRKLLLIRKSNTTIITRNNTIEFCKILLQKCNIFIINHLDSFCIDRANFFCLLSHNVEVKRRNKKWKFQKLELISFKIREIIKIFRN